MPPLMQLPQYEIKNALVNFQPVSDAIDSNRAYGLQQRNADLQEKQFGLQKRSADEQSQERFRQRMGGVVQEMILKAPNEQVAQERWQRLMTDPNFAPHFQTGGYGKGPWREEASRLAAEARGYVNPLDEMAKRAQIASSQSNTALHQQQLSHNQLMSPIQLERARAEAESTKFQTPEGRAAVAQRFGIQPGTPAYQSFALMNQLPAAQPDKTMEVNGKVVTIPSGGQTAKVVYDGGPNFDKLPEFAAKSAGFTSRMVEAEHNLRATMQDKASFDPTSAWTAAARSVPEGVGNYFVRPEKMQQYQQASEQWIRAFLRKESGAAIGKDEFARDFKVYFPQPGDAPSVVKQKEQARLDAMRSFQMETRGYFDHTSPQHAQRMKEWTSGATPTTPTARHTATNPQTGQKIVSDDGVNWRPADGR